MIHFYLYKKYDYYSIMHSQILFRILFHIIKTSLAYFLTFVIISVWAYSLVSAQTMESTQSPQVSLQKEEYFIGRPVLIGVHFDRESRINLQREILIIPK